MIVTNTTNSPFRVSVRVAVRDAQLDQLARIDGDKGELPLLMDLQTKVHELHDQLGISPRRQTLLIDTEATRTSPLPAVNTKDVQLDRMSVAANEQRLLMEIQTTVRQLQNELGMWPKGKSPIEKIDDAVVVGCKTLWSRLRSGRHPKEAAGIKARIDHLLEDYVRMEKVVSSMRVP